MKSLFKCENSKTCVKPPLKKKNKNWVSRPIITECRSKVLQNALLEHSAILSTFIKLLFVFKTFVFSIFELPVKIGFTVNNVYHRISIYLSPSIFVCDIFI